VLVEKELDWNGQIVNILEKENLDPSYLRLNPKGVVPTLVDADRVITESTIIMEYLDTAYKPHSLKPDSAYAQATMRKWLKWVDEHLHANWAGLGWTILIRPTWLEKSSAEVSALLTKLIDPARRDRQERLLKLGYMAPEFKQSLGLLERQWPTWRSACNNSLGWLARSQVSPILQCCPTSYLRKNSELQR